MSPPLKLCFAASEVAPFAKTGGLADVASALPRQLHRNGHEVRVFLPLYSVLDRQGQEFHAVEFARDVRLDLGRQGASFTLRTARLPGSELAIYFVDCPELYHRPSIYTGAPDEARRFAFFSRAVLESCQRMGWPPDVIHCHDWHTGLLPILLRGTYEWDSLFHRTRTMLTIHNIGFQGVFPAALLDELGLGGSAHMFDSSDLASGSFGFLKSGLIHADVLTTVSPTYAGEIRSAEYGQGLDGLLRARAGRLVGILNGVDYEEWSPEHDRFIPHRYSRKRPAGKAKNKAFLLDRMGLQGTLDAPLIGVVSRLTEQKGFDLCMQVLPDLLDRTDVCLVVLGSGDERYERFFQRLRDVFPDRVGLYRGYNNELAHLIEAASDLFLMPSLYEPCGLNQMFSLRYGTIPIVRRTGGLADSVEPFDGHSGEGTGFLFEPFTADALRQALIEALRAFRNPPLWRRLMANAMAQNFSWERQAKRYEELYRWLGSL